MRQSRPIAAAALAALAVLLVVAGCGERRSQEAPAAGQPAARLIATAGYGERVLLERSVAADQSALRALRGATDVDTAYGGGYVAAMLGRRSDLAARRDWFYYVNGALAGRSAREVTLRDGDVLWWDHRHWGGLMNAWAVVGLWPAPLVVAGRSPAPVAADPPLAGALRTAGAELASGDAPWRARVGESGALAARDAAWRRALADPDRAGLTVAIGDGVVTTLAPDGTRRPVPGARALVAAVPTGADPSRGVLVAVAGLDAAAARAAADRIARDPGVLALRYAVAFDGRGRPLRAGGRAGP